MYQASAPGSLHAGPAGGGQQSEDFLLLLQVRAVLERWRHGQGAQAAPHAPSPLGSAPWGTSVTTLDWHPRATSHGKHKSKIGKLQTGVKGYTLEWIWRTFPRRGCGSTGVRSFPSPTCHAHGHIALVTFVPFCSAKHLCFLHVA